MEVRQVDRRVSWKAERRGGGGRARRLRRTGQRDETPRCEGDASTKTQENKEEGKAGERRYRWDENRTRKHTNLEEEEDTS